MTKTARELKEFLKNYKGSRSAVNSGQLECDVRGIPADEWFRKLKFVSKQTAEMMDKSRPFVRCGCRKRLWPYQAYKCLYCGEWYCLECAEKHFGKTVEQYRKEHPIKSSYKR